MLIATVTYGRAQERVLDFSLSLVCYPWEETERLSSGYKEEREKYENEEEEELNISNVSSSIS